MSNDQPQAARHQSGDPTLTEFLLARIAQDEAYWGSGRGLLKTRMLRECEAKRRIVEACAGLTQDLRDLESDTGVNIPTPDRAEARILGALAVIYSDHPDYRDEWRP